MRELLTRANGGLDSAVIADHLSDMAALSLRTVAIMPRLQEYVWLCGLSFCMG